MHIEQIVAGLADPYSAATPLLRQELVIRLGMWMQYSGQPKKLTPTTFGGIVAYLRERCEAARPDRWQDQH